MRTFSESGSRNFLHDGSNVFVELDGSGSLEATYTQYPGVDRPHSMRRGAATYYYATDALGSVVGLFDAGSNVENDYRYDDFGAPEEVQEWVENPYLFTARAWDEGPELYYYRARYYDPDLDRFISEDPAGLSAGINPYVYVGNSPLNGRDPSGLGECWRSPATGEYVCSTLLVTVSATGGTTLISLGGGSDHGFFGRGGDVARRVTRDLGAFSPAIQPSQPDWADCLAAGGNFVAGLALDVSSVLGLGYGGRLLFKGGVKALGAGISRHLVIPGLSRATVKKGSREALEAQIRSGASDLARGTAYALAPQAPSGADYLAGVGEDLFETFVPFATTKEDFEAARGACGSVF